MDWSMNISGGNGIVGLRWYALTADWMDCCVYVPREHEIAAREAIKIGVKEFWERNDQCYGDCIEYYLSKVDIPYLIEHCVYDPDTDEVYPVWEDHFDYLRSRGIPIHTVETER